MKGSSMYSIVQSAATVTVLGRGFPFSRAPAPLQ